MIDEELSKLTVKRKVSIKSIVTSDFKKRMVYDLNQAITGIQSNMGKLDETMMGGHVSEDYTKQLERKKQQHELTIEDIKLKIEKIKKLELDSLFTQGLIDGFVTIQKGDDLFEELGTMDILLKDGIVQDIAIKKDLQLAVDN